jgi:methylamine dehydrogenase accessory protein MauD
MERIWLASYFLAWFLVAAQGLALIAALCVLGRIHLRSDLQAQVLVTDDGPAIDAPMPEFEGVDAAGKPVRSRDYRGEELLLLLLSPDCAPCEQLLREVEESRRHLLFETEFVSVMETHREEVARSTKRYRLRFPVIVDPEASLRKQLGVARTPYAFLIDAEGIVRMKGVVNRGAQLEALIARRGTHFAGLEWQTEG